MTWADKIRFLQSAGLTQQVIADRCGTGQGLISDLATGRRGKRISYEIGTAINALVDEQSSLLASSEA